MEQTTLPRKNWKKAITQTLVSDCLSEMQGVSLCSSMRYHTGFNCNAGLEISGKNCTVITSTQHTN